ncbi:MAG: hypothetical protein RLP02_02830 [Coleofasciculus sp. C2-GNP5-27]
MVIHENNKVWGFYLVQVLLVMGALVLGVPIINIIISSGVAFKTSDFIMILILSLFLLFIFAVIYINCISIMKTVISATFYIQKSKAEFFKSEKTYSGHEHIEKHNFNEVEKILIIKEIYSDNSDEYHVVIQLSNGKELSVLTYGFYEKRPALELVQCINQFINLSQNSIEIINKPII